MIPFMLATSAWKPATSFWQMPSSPLHPASSTFFPW